MSCNIQTALFRNGLHLDVIYDLPSQFVPTDPGIDDPVNDTGLLPWHGDLQLSAEFAS